MTYSLRHIHRGLTLLGPKDENDTPECFANGYDFKETFLGPYQV